MDKTTDPITNTGLLFEGKSFWLSRSIPQRNRFMDIIEANGGIVVALENKADIKLVDHTRRDNPPGTYSYQYVEKSVRNGKLENLEDHSAGPSSTRLAGPTRSSEISKPPPRRGKVEYTLEDDQVLWDWMQSYEKNGTGGFAKVPYRLLAEVNPRHTAESWRTRWTKHLRGLPRPGGPRQEDEELQAVASAPPVDSERSSHTRETHTTDATPARLSVANIGARRAESPGTKWTVAGTSVKKSQIPVPDDPSSSSVLTSPGPHATTERRVREVSPAKYTSHKRKRVSAHELSHVPTFDIDYQENRKRRATDYGPRHKPSTLHRLHPTDTTHKNRSSQVTQIEATESEVFETAPQFQITQDRLLTQQSTVQPSVEEDLNLKALLELPFPAATSGPEDGSSRAQAEVSGTGSLSIDDWIESRLRSGKSVDERHIIQALRVTSMDPILADKVLDVLSSGKGIPQHMRGVWTAEDDACVEGTDARNIDHVLKKHGTELYNARFEYLEMIAELQRAQSRLSSMTTSGP